MEVYCFDNVMERKHTGSFKWDCSPGLNDSTDIIPMWVADMDFACAPPIVEAVKKRAAHPIYGYTVRSDSFVHAVAGWLEKRHNCKVPREWLTFAPPGVIFALHIMLDILTEKGDKVAIHMPNYDPLFDLVTKTGRQLVKCPLERNAEGYYNIDIDTFREIICREKPKAMILSSPHNPTGRVWTHAELQGIADVCIENDVFMLIDEIHADFVAGDRKHIAFATLGEEAAKHAAICYSANKGFNLGGLQMCSLVIADADKREAFEQRMTVMQTRLDNVFGDIATEIAYTDTACMKWLDEVIAYVEANKKYVREYLSLHCPQITAMETEGTYFAWLNCEQLHLSGKELEAFMLKEARVAFCAGYEFGEEGEAFLRMNLACPHSTVEEAMRRVTSAVQSLSSGEE